VQAFDLALDGSGLRLVSEAEERAASAWKFDYELGEERFEATVNAPSDDLPAITRIARSGPDLA
jgi:hypothetical protein